VNINLTLIVQMIVFMLLIWFTMRFVWPMILGAMNERETRIANGLAAAENGERALVEARSKADAMVREVRERAKEIIDHAQHRATEMIEEAKGAASAEAARLVAAAQQQIQLDTVRARESLRREVAGIAVRAASKLLAREIDARKHADLLDQLAAQI
jgi:F-type H+-transporting ATPase subunit b